MSFFSAHVNAEMPDKREVSARTPNPASGQLIAKLDAEGVETVWDRFEAQQPQCGFGQRGTCCRMCQWGPCRITAKSPRGVCGRDMNQVVIANIVRALVSGLAGHASHAYEVVATLIAAAEGRADIPLRGLDRVFDLAERFGVPSEGREPGAVAAQVGRTLLADIGRLEAEPMACLEAFAPADRREVWERLDVMPRSASFETMETLHMTTLGGCSDWEAMAAQELRAALAYCYGTLFTSSLATEALYGIPTPKTTEVNYGVLKPDHVNILLHGHSPVMVEKVIEHVRRPEVQALAREAGAVGVVLGGMCCTGDELLARYGIPTVTNIMGQELALGTGAVDAVIVDMQCVIPGMKIVADCFGTLVITTNRSNRIPGALHVPFDPALPETLDADAERVARAAVEAFRGRDRSKMRIPEVTTRASAGWSYEAVLEAAGGAGALAEALRDGTVTGLATIVGCNTPKVAYEANHVGIARRLVEAGVLLTTTGCCSHALLNAGLCSPEAAQIAPPETRAFLRVHGLPPVLAVGGCVDNVRSLRLMVRVAEAAGLSVAEMPFMFIGPEPGNEKTVGQGATFLIHGVSNLVGFPAPVPVPQPTPKAGGLPGEMDPGRNDIVEFFGGDGLLSKVGAKVYTEPDPANAAQTVRMHLHRKRLALGWTDGAKVSMPAAAGSDEGGTHEGP